MKQKLILVVLTVLITAVLQFIFTSFIAREYHIKQSVTKSYVDNKDKEITVAFRKGDAQVKEYCNGEIEEMKETQKRDFDFIIEEIRLNRTAITNNN